MLYGHNTNAAGAPRHSARSPSGLNAGGSTSRALSPQHHYRHGSAAGSAMADGINSFSFIHEAIRNHGAELELERRTREAAVRDLSARTSVEIGELREMIKQLRQENSTLKDQVWSLEKRKAAAGSSGVVSLPADSYFGGSTALTNVQLPLIPRVTDLENSIDQLTSKVSKLQASEKAREEALQKAVVEQQLQQREALEHAKEFARSECDRREAARIEPLEQHQREAAAAHSELQRLVGKQTAEHGGQLASLADRLRAAEEGLNAVTSDRQTQNQLDEWKRVMKATAEVEADKLKSTLADLRADMAKAARRQESADLEVQEALQSYVGQRVDVLRAEMLPREELAKITALVTTAQKDTDRAADAAQNAKVVAEEARRELTRRVAALEADESSLEGRVVQLASDVAGGAQATKAVAAAVDELRAAVKANHAATADASDRLTAASGKQFEHAALLDAVGQDVARLKALQAAAATTEGTERQQIKERLHVAEDEVKALKAKLAAVDEAQQTQKKDTDRALNDVRSTVGAEERASNQLSQQRTVTALAALEARLAAVDGRCDGVEEGVAKVREEVLSAVRAKAEATKEYVNERLGECDEACKGRQREAKEALGRVEEKTANVALRAKALEAAVEGLPTQQEVERAVIEAKDAASKTSARLHAEQTKETNAIREDSSAFRAATEKAISDLQSEAKARALDTASKAVLEDLRVRVDDVVAAIDQHEAAMASNISKTVRDRLKPLQDAQTAQKEEFDEFQQLTAELAQRLKTVVGSVEGHDEALKEHGAALEAADKSRASVFNELMMAVSVACSHEQQYGAHAEEASSASPAPNGGAASVTPRVSITSMGDVVQYILNCVADAQQELQEQVQGLERLRSASMQHPPPVTDDDVHAALQTVSVPLMELTKIVDRHEKGFSIIPELVQGIRFNNKGLINVATAVGVSTDGLKIRALDDSELQEALSEAADGDREREYEITEKERHWM